MKKNKALLTLLKVVEFIFAIWSILALISIKNNLNPLILQRNIILIISLFGILILAVLYTKAKSNSNDTRDIKWNIDIIIFRVSSVLAIVMFWVWCNVYFKVGWDVWTIDYAAKVLAGQAEYITWLTSYLSQYPNNLVLVWIYSITLKINSMVGIIDVNNGQIVFIFLNTIISWLTVVLTYWCIKKKTNNSKIAICGWIMAVIMIGISPWATVPYSDALTVGIPITIYALYIKAEKEDAWYLYAAIGLIGVIGYNIKPQSIIVLLAIIFASFFQHRERDIREKIKVVCGMIIGIICAVVICNSMISAVKSKIPIDQDKAFTYTHWLMMGTNEKTKGRYNGEDCDYSAGFATKDERTKAELVMTRERLEKYGIAGYLALLTNKLAMTYEDGTFSWFTGTGEFATEVYEEKNIISKYLRECFYYEGRYYPILSTVLEIVWFEILCLCILGLCKRGENIDVILELTVLGTAVFELIFEVFTRHLYCNISIYIVLAMYSLNVMTKTIQRKQ